MRACARVVSVQKFDSDSDLDAFTPLQVLVLLSNCPTLKF